MRLASRIASARPCRSNSNVIGLAAVIEGIFEADAVAIGQPPARILEKLVNLDAGEGFVGHASRPECADTDMQAFGFRRLRTIPCLESER